MQQPQLWWMLKMAQDLVSHLIPADVSVPFWEGQVHVRRRKFGLSVPCVAFQDLRNMYMGQKVMRLGVTGPSQQ